MYFTHVLCLKDNSYYTGYSSNLKERLKAHKKGAIPSTKNLRPLKLVYYSAFETRKLATGFEKYLKPLPVSLSGTNILFKSYVRLFMGIIDFLFPATCLECGSGSKYLCDKCVSKMALAKQFCLGCHKPSIDGATHAKCKRKMSIDFAYALWNYSGVIRKAIVNLKYRFAFKIAEEIAEKFVDKIKSGIFIFPTKAVLVPIPLHSSRHKWRGFNQTEILGEVVAQKMNWLYEPILTKNKKTETQTMLKGKDRVSNLTGAFSVKQNFADRNVPYIIFDDVLTTGSTLKEACKALKRKGVKNVLGLTIAA